MILTRLKLLWVKSRLAFLDYLLDHGIAERVDEEYCRACGRVAFSDEPCCLLCCTMDEDLT